MRRLRLPLLAAAASFVLACTPSPADEPAPGAPAETAGDREASGAATANAEPGGEPASQPTSQPAGADNDPTERVADALARLQASPAGQTVLRAIEAHGGLERYFANGALTFRFRYAPRGDRGPIDTVQTIDTWSARAAHHLTGSPDVRFGWDGDVAWVAPPGAELPSNPRFWALTPYYFVGVPFVFADPGVQLEALEPEVFEDRTYDRVRVTFGDGVGDAPDDYYIVLVDQESGRVGGVRYVVSYPGFFPDGGHSPEKLMVYDGAQVIDGITFPETFRTFSLGDDGKPDVIVTDSSMLDVRFEGAVDDARFAPPEGAQIIDGFGAR